MARGRQGEGTAGVREGWRAFLARPWAPAGVLLVLGLLLYLPVCGYRFQAMDDGVNVYENPHLLSFAWSNLLFFWRGAYQGLYIPITYNLWALLAGMSELLLGGSPLNPFLFHLANLLLHVTNAILVWRILRELGQEEGAALLGAAFFLLHPVQVEAVAWVSGLKDLGSGCLALLAIWRYLRWCHADAAATGVRISLGGQCFVFFLGALLAKPGTVVLPLVFLVFGRICLQRSWRRLAAEIIPLLCVAFFFVVVARQVQMVRSWDFLPAPWQRLLVAGDALLFYLGKVTLPLVLTADYGRTPQAVLGGNAVWFTAPLAYLLALVVGVKASRPWRVAAAIFVVFLFPVLGLLTFHFQSISTVADRYLYLALLGPALAVSFFASGQRRRWVWAGLLLYLAFLGAKSMSQRQFWFDTLSLNDQILRVNPASWTAYLNRGIARRDQQFFQGAVDDFNQVLRYTPSEGNVHNHLGITYFNWGRYPEALAAYRRALVLDPKSAGANYNLALLYDTIGEEEEAIHYCRQALALEKGHGRAYITLGNAQLKLGREGEAIEAFANAFQAGMLLPEIAFNLGGLYMKAKQPGLAIEWYRRAIELNPGFGQAYSDLAAIYQQLGELAAAREYAAKARELGGGGPPR